MIIELRGINELATAYTQQKLKAKTERSLRGTFDRVKWYDGQKRPLLPIETGNRLASGNWGRRSRTLHIIVEGTMLINLENRAPFTIKELKDTASMGGAISPSHHKIRKNEHEWFQVVSEYLSLGLSSSYFTSNHTLPSIGGNDVYYPDDWVKHWEDSDFAMLYTSEHGRVVAMYNAEFGLLYVLVPLQSMNSGEDITEEEEVKFWDELLSWVESVTSQDEGEGGDEEEQQEQDPKEKAIAELTKVLHSQHVAELNDVLGRMEEAKREMSYLTQRLREENNKYVALKYKARGMELRANDEKALAKKQIEGILSVNGVKNVRMEGSYLVIETEHITIPHDELDYDIGEFDVVIDLLNNKEDGIRFFNKTRNCIGYWDKEQPHPHIDDRGQPCFGNVASTLAVLLSENDFESAASVIVGFLKSVDSNDCAGAFIKAWPYWAGDCLVSTDVVKCEMCENPVEFDDSYETSDEERICPDCYEACYTDCLRCGESVRRDDTQYCDICGERCCSSCVEDRNVEGTWLKVCSSCVANDLVECKNCGDTIHQHNSYYLESRDMTCCECCYDELMEEREEE